MGVSPGWGGALRLTKLLGRTAALHLLLSSQPLGAQEALEREYATCIVPHAHVRQEVLAFLRPYITQPHAGAQYKIVFALVVELQACSLSASYQTGCVRSCDAPTQRSAA
jgi:enoyl-CoA hydratase/carnithine racemase